MTSLEIHVAISPTPVFFNRMHYLAASLAEHGGHYADSPLVVTVGEDVEPFDLAEDTPWAGNYPIEFRWLPRADYQRRQFWATRNQRLHHRHTADQVLLLDPDVLVVGPLDELVQRSHDQQALLGFPAHVSPVDEGFSWDRLFAAAGLGPALNQVEHTGYGFMFHDTANRYSPPYFNLGVIMAPAAHLALMATTIDAELEIAAAASTKFRSQPALTMAMLRHDVPWELMNARYNFPNDDRFIDRYPDCFDDLRLVHYLRKDDFDKESTFGSPEQIGALLDRTDVGRVNRRFFDLIEPVHARVVADLAAPAPRRRRLVDTLRRRRAET